MRNKYLEFYNASFVSGEHCTKSWGLASFQAGAKSRQAEIEDLQKRIDEALNKLCQLQYASAERVYSDVSKILKGDLK